MANFDEKKYLDLDGLRSYDAKIKKLIGDADTTLSNAINQVSGDLTSEIANRAAGDKAINDKIGGNFDAENTVAKAIEDAAKAAGSANEALEKRVKANENAISAINNEETGILAQAEAYADSAVAVEAARADAAEKANAKAISDEVARATKAEEDLQAAIDAHEEFVDAKLTTLIGEDTDKSVREIANEELAAQLIGEDAKESLDTLKEIADWIQQHPDDAAAMNKAIEDLEKLVGTIPADATATDIVGYIAEAVAAEAARAKEAEKTNKEAIEAEAKRADEAEKANAKAIADEKTRAEGVEAGLDGRLDAVEALLGEGGGVDERIAAAINALDNEVTSTGSELVTVKVDQVDGKVTTVTVSEDLANTYDAKGAAATAESNAKAYTNDLEESFVKITSAEIEGLFA